MAHYLPDLDYAYDALEPVIDEETMKLHHLGHHKAYVEKFNSALEEAPELEEKQIEKLLSNLAEVPENVRESVRNNGGGHYNHSFFWTILSPRKTAPGKELSNGINSKFDSFDNFAKVFTDVAAKHFGSGYAWLSVDKTGELVVESLPNQDTPLAKDRKPILLLDLWEHAYYLKYHNQKNDYIRAFWNIVNWPMVEQNYLKARS